MRRLFFLTLVVVLLVAMVPVAVSAETECVVRYHTVQRGEYLTLIANWYGVSAYAIAQANGISNMNLLYVGTVLVIPCGAAPPPAPSCIHVVGHGEWLSTIARRYGTTWQAIAAANGIANPNYIYPGQQLVIPGCSPAPPTPPPPPPVPTPPPPGPVPPPECGVTPVLGFFRVWSQHEAVHQKLGCATAPEYGIPGAIQHFENGIVIWRGDQDPVTVLYRDGSWGTLPDPWDDCHCVTPLAPYVGWPSSGRWEGNVSVEFFTGGTMMWSSCCGFYVINADGTWSYFS